MLWRVQGGGIRVRRQLLEDASAHHLLLHTGQLEALTCPATIMHRCPALPGLLFLGALLARRPLLHQAGVSPWPPCPGLYVPRCTLHCAACSIRDDVVPLALVQRLADELQRSSRSFHLELLPVRAWGRGRRGMLPWRPTGCACTAGGTRTTAATGPACLLPPVHKFRVAGACFKHLLASLVQDGDHRLSREADLQLMCQLLGQLVQSTLEGMAVL